MRKPLLAALAALACAAPLAGLPATELFPAEPGGNAERGFAVAVDGDWLAMGAHRDDEKQRDAGAVYLFKWSGTTWDQTAKLFAELPRERAHLGFSLALRDGVLAAGAPGEGAVYLFALQEEDAWVPAQRLTGPPRAFGRSLALDGNRLAVGSVGGHGATDGAVYLYLWRDGSWGLQQNLQPRTRRTGERFGAAVALAGKILAVGAPGHGAGAVYVFQRDPSRWREKAKLHASADGPPLAGDQLGAAVATDGTQIFAGAPTAGPDNSGAVYRFEQGAGGWLPQRLEIEAASGDQLGASLALDGDLLVAGAPAPPPGSGTGRVHVLLVGNPLEPPVPGNAEIRDLAGFAVAVDGRRVVVGGVLGDQGAGAAGAAWSFDCSGEACTEEAEAVARDPLLGKRFGISVALAGDHLVVGAPESDASVTGAVYLYRRAENGWRQEERLTSAYRGDGFGSSVALEGSLLAVGAPQGRSVLSGEPPQGSVDLFVRRGSSWSFEAMLAPPCGTTAGTSVAISDGVVAVGAPGCKAVYLFEKGTEGWTEVSVLTDPAEGFGAAVSLRGKVLSLGAPEANGGAGAAYVSVRGDGGWSAPQPLLGRTGGKAVVIDPLELGASVSVGDGFLAIGAPGFHGGDGAVFVLAGEGASWGQPIQISSLARRRFGSSVALFGNRLAVGGPGEEGTDPDDLDRAALFEHGEEGWVPVADLDALQPPDGDAFGTAVALSERFLVVTSPGPARGDRVTVFALPEEGEP